ncbi:MAG: porin [Planctomycetota bacterium]
MQRNLTTGVLAAALCTPVVAMGESSAELDALRAEMAAMQAELAQLKGGTTAQATADLKAATDAALLDAQSRINYQAEEMTAGHNGKNFFLESADGAFSLGLSAQAQVRYIYNNRTNAPGTGIDDGDNLAGFQLRRTKIKGKGHIADPKVTYSFSFSSNRDTNNTGLEVLTVGYKFDNGINLTAGRFKAPFAFDELTSSSRQQAAERALVTEQFTLGHTEGIQVDFKPMDDLKIRAMLSDGANAGEGGNGDFNETPADLAITVRGDYTIGGSKGFAKDYTSWVEDEMGINIGGAVHHEVAKTGVNQATGGLDSFTRLTVDALYNNSGISFFAAAYFEVQEAAGGGVESDPFGLLAQAGYTIDDKWEPFVRYEFIDTDVAGVDEVSVITAGVNYYLKKHSAKFTIDGVFVLDPLDATNLTVSDSLGLQGDAAGEDGQFALRAQFQLLF